MVPMSTTIHSAVNPHAVFLYDTQNTQHRKCKHNINTIQIHLRESESLCRELFIVSTVRILMLVRTSFERNNVPSNSHIYLYTIYQHLQNGKNQTVLNTIQLNRRH
jgi:hypothetical protein